MSIGKFCLIVVLSLTACQKNPGTAEKPQTAWWYDIEFEVSGQALREVAINRIDPTWQAAKELTEKDIQGRISPAEFKKFKDSGFVLAMTADLNGDGAQENFFVGVSQKVGGGGRFVAVKHNGSVRVFQEQGRAGFSALMKSPEGIRWYKCMECSEFETVSWSAGSYTLQ